MLLRKEGSLSPKDQRAVDLLTEAEALLASILMDVTEEVFEEAPDIDRARNLVHDAIRTILNTKRS